MEKRISDRFSNGQVLAKVTIVTTSNILFEETWFQVRIKTCTINTF